MLALIKEAARVHAFRVSTSQDYTARQMSRAEQGAWVDDLLNRSVRIGQKLVHVQHTFWIDILALPGVSTEECCTVDLELVIGYEFES